MSPATRLVEQNQPEALSGNRAGGQSRQRAGLLAAIVSAVLVASYALWYASSGLFPVFPAIQNDYVDLGQSFLHGQLSLLERPDPRLASLGNPYEYTQRKAIPYHWDASYYEGKYYLYWGPVPAIISAMLEAVGGSPPSASLLVVIPYIGLLGIAIVLLFHLSQTFGPDSRMTVFLFILIGFFNLPMLFTLGQPRHYQASIMYGQFFLLAGLLGIVLYSRSGRAYWLLVSGLALGLAFGSRYNLVISVAIYMVAAAVWLWRDRAFGAFWKRLNLLLAPLVLCLVGLALYNLARFGNPLETGLTYQLTIPEFRQISYSTAYVPSSLYIYLTYPLTGSPTFPFIQSAHFRPSLIPETLVIPPGREFDQVAFGLFPSVPAMWLFAIGIPLLLVAILFRNIRPPLQTLGASPAWIFSTLAAGAAAQFAFLLVFFYVAERYVVDFYIPVVICLAIIVWRGLAAIDENRFLRMVYWALVVVLTTWTVAIGYFACFGVPVLVSIYYDPRMLADLAVFWNKAYAVLHHVLSGAP